MPAIRFASNNISHFPGSQPGSLGTSFDASRVPYSLGFTNYQVLTSPTFAAVAGTVTWVHFRYMCEGNPYSTPTGSSGTLCQAMDALNRPLFRLSKRNPFYSQEVVLTLFNGTTSIVVNGLLPLAVSKINTVDVALTITPSLIKADLYINGALSATATFGSNPNSMGNPVRITLASAFSDSLTQSGYFSEIIVADGDTRNARLNFLRPAAGGALSQWDGILASMGDDDPTTGLYTTMPNERHSFEPSPYVGAQNISNLVTVSQTVRGLNSPTKLQHFLRQGGVNYDSPNIDIGFDLQYNLVDLALNPSSSAPFTSSDISTLEVGFRSVA